MKNLIPKLLPFIAMITLFLISCDADSNTGKIDAELERPSEVITEAFENKREQLQREMQEAQEMLENKIQTLEEKKEGAEEAAKTEIDQKLTELNDLRKSMNADMKKLGDNIEDSWEEFDKNYDWDKFSRAVLEKIREVNNVEVE
jgi:Skp family chaperone for outer membrane proteins